MRSEEEKVKIAALWRHPRVGALSLGEEGLSKSRAWNPMSAAVRSAPLVLTRVFAWLALPILPQKESQPEAESTKDSEEDTPLPKRD